MSGTCMMGDKIAWRVKEERMGREYDQICPLVASKRNTRDYTDRFFHSFRIEASSFRHDSQDDESWCCSALRSLQCLSAEGVH